MASDLASPHQPGVRSRHWLKIKRRDPTPRTSRKDLIRPADQTTASSTSCVTYDSVAGQYVFVWKTDKAQSGGSKQKASFMPTRCPETLAR